MAKMVVLYGADVIVHGSIAAKLADVNLGALPVVTTGYYAAGDGGGNVYYYDAGSSATINGGTVLPSSGGSSTMSLNSSGVYDGTDAGTGRYLAIEARYDPVLFGADPTGVTDATKFWLACVAAGSIISPSGTGIYSAQNVVISTDNMQLNGNGTKITRNADTGANNVLSVSGDYCTVDGMTLDGGGSAFAASNGPCLAVSGNNNTIRNCTFQNGNHNSGTGNVQIEPGAGSGSFNTLQDCVSIDGGTYCYNVSSGSATFRNCDAIITDALTTAPPNGLNYRWFSATTDVENVFIDGGNWIFDNPLYDFGANFTTDGGLSQRLVVKPNSVIVKRRATVAGDIGHVMKTQGSWDSIEVSFFERHTSTNDTNQPVIPVFSFGSTRHTWIHDCDWSGGVEFLSGAKHAVIERCVFGDGEIDSGPILLSAGYCQTIVVREVEFRNVNRPTATNSGVIENNKGNATDNLSTAFGRRMTFENVTIRLTTIPDNHGDNIYIFRRCPDSAYFRSRNFRIINETLAVSPIADFYLTSQPGGRLMLTADMEGNLHFDHVVSKFFYTEPWVPGESLALNTVYRRLHNDIAGPVSRVWYYYGAARTTGATWDATEEAFWTNESDPLATVGTTVTLAAHGHPVPVTGGGDAFPTVTGVWKGQKIINDNQANGHNAAGWYYTGTQWSEL